jgi:hypothetical protein
VSDKTLASTHSEEPTNTLKDFEPDDMKCKPTTDNMTPPVGLITSGATTSITGGASISTFENTAGEKLFEQQ